MSRNARALVLALAVVVLVAGFAIAQQAGDDDDSSSPATVAQVRPAGSAGSQDDARAEATEAEESGAEAADESHGAQAAEPAEPRPPLVRVEGQQPVGGVQDLVFEKGDGVDFRVRSDIDEELHVHGYDVTEALPAGETVRVRFPADIEGRFEVELHGAAVQIALLEVRP